MAKSQISISKNPTAGARYFKPREINISRIVPMLTSAILAVKISKGRINHKYKPDSKNVPSYMISSRKSIRQSQRIAGNNYNPSDKNPQHKTGELDYKDTKRKVNQLSPKNNSLINTPKNYVSLLITPSGISKFA